MSMQPETYKPATVRECINTLRTSGDLMKISAAWAWLEFTFGYTLAMEYLSDYDEDAAAMAVLQEQGTIQ